MTIDLRQIILETTKASDLVEGDILQELWSGYGKIRRYELVGSEHQSVVVKHIDLTKHGSHPRGWNNQTSHQRKLRSYQIETAWYQNYAHHCPEACRIPRCFGVESSQHETLIVLEDLATAGFPKTPDAIGWPEIERCLSWLANFHATFMGKKPDQLWKTGTYWHLQTRPDEWQALDDQRLKDAAQAIDQVLQKTPYQTLVHGDAKLANFCFSWDQKKVAAVDFQYVGGGCGMKDVAYFIGNCLAESACERQESQILDFYFNQLKKGLKVQGILSSYQDIEDQWRPLYPVAWTDFHRFLKGWSPGHWKINDYSERLSRQVMDGLHKDQS